MSQQLSDKKKKKSLGQGQGGRGVTDHLSACREELSLCANECKMATFGKQLRWDARFIQSGLMGERRRRWDYFKVTVGVAKWCP